MLKLLTEYIKEKRNSPLKYCSKKEVQNVIDADMPESVKVDILNRLPDTRDSLNTHRATKQK